MSDLREQLAAAMAGTADEGETPPVITPEAPPTAETAAPGEAAPETTNEQTGDKPAGAVERDEHGRFAPKESKAAPETTPAAEVKTETAPPADTGAQTEPTRVPPSLPAAVKAKFATLDTDVQQAFGKLEESVQTAKAEWGRKGERLNRYDEIIGPQLDKWRASGLDEFSGIQTLISAQAILERNPVDGLQFLARSYGVNLQALAQQAVGQTPAQEGQPAPTLPPGFDSVLNPLVEQVRTLQQHFERQTQSTEAANLAEARSEVAQFASKPENMYFENVKDDVVRRLQSGAAATLAEAYEQATWASPEIRPLLLKAQAPAPVVDTAKKDAEAAQRKKAEAARNAAGSVTGAPAPGAKAPQGPTGSVRDTLMAAMQEHGANV